MKAWWHHLALLVLSWRRMSWSATLALAVRTTLSSLPIAMVICWFAAAMLTVQVASSIRSLGAIGMTGVVVGFGGVREVFPLLAAGALSARSAADIAATIATLRVTKQWDAIVAMGLSPYPLVIVPRLLACMIAGPLCVLGGTAAGLAGAYVIGWAQLGIDRGEMGARLMAAVVPLDLLTGLLRGLLAGAVCGVVATFEGVQAGADVRDVGRAAKGAVVHSMVIVATLNLLFSLLAYR
jgi:phospholipid/cholesterol/gamma-HCH transport system permease protein